MQHLGACTYPEGCAEICLGRSWSLYSTPPFTLSWTTNRPRGLLAWPNGVGHNAPLLLVPLAGRTLQELFKMRCKIKWIRYSGFTAQSACSYAEESTMGSTAQSACARAG